MRLKPTGCYAFYQQLAEVTVKITPLFSRGGGGEAAAQLKALQHLGHMSCVSLLLISNLSSHQRYVRPAQYISSTGRCLQCTK